jgi:hypothetical protein
MLYLFWQVLFLVRIITDLCDVLSLVFYLVVVKSFYDFSGKFRRAVRLLQHLMLLFLLMEESGEFILN